MGVHIPVEFLVRLLDLLLFTALACVSTCIVMIGWLLGAILRGKRDIQHRRALFMVPTVLEDLKNKGVTWMIETRDENGYFEHVYSVHPFTPLSRVVEINDKHTVIEFGGRFRTLYAAGLKFSFYLFTVMDFLYNTNRLIKREHISLIRAQDPYVIGLLGILSSALTRVPCCISIHADYDKRYELDGSKGAPVYFGSREVAKRLERFVLSHAKMVMPIRESLGKSAVANGAKPETIRVIPHGVDLSPFLQEPNPDFKRDWGLEGKRLVVFVGRLSKENYVYDILEIAKVIYQRYSDVVFAMLGDGNEAESLKRKIEKDGLSECMQLLGFQPQEVVVDFRQNADVNICLMAGFSLIEAASSGRPIVSYDVEWHYELVRNGDTGFLVPEGDIDAASEAIIKLLDNPELAGRLGENARKLAIAHHSLEITSWIRVKWYEELMQSGG